MHCTYWLYAYGALGYRKAESVQKKGVLALGVRIGGLSKPFFAQLYLRHGSGFTKDHIGHKHW